MRLRANTFDFKPFSTKQKQLIYWWAEGSPYKDCDIVIAEGSIRSGKTIAGICSFLLFSINKYQDQAFVIAGKTVGALKRNVIKPMLSILESWGLAYNYNRSENFIEVGGNTYFLFGANNEASQDSLQGLTAAGAYADEVALFPRSFVEQMIARCSIKGAKLFWNCNPESPYHYIKTNYIDEAENKNLFVLHFTMDDNLTLPHEVKAMYRRMYSGAYYKRYVQGKWVAAEGLIYEQFANNLEDYVVTEDYLGDHPIHIATIGVDFGGNKSAHSFTLTGFTRGYREVITLDEWYLKKEITPERLNRAFIDFVLRSRAKYRLLEVYCDSAESTLIQGLRTAALNANLPIEVRKARKGPINDRIALYNTLIAQKRWKIVKHCTHTIEAYSQAVYDDSKLQDVRLDDGNMNIDSIDSQEYSTEWVQDVLLAEARELGNAKGSTRISRDLSRLID